MKKLLIVNFVFVFIFIACFWTFALFTHGAFVNLVGLGAGVICGFISMLLLPCVVILGILDIYCLFKYWQEAHLKTFLPLIILVLGIYVSGTLNVYEMSIKRFKKHQSDYEAFVSKLVKEHEKGKWESITIPKEYRHLGYWCAVYDDEPNNVYISFCVGHFGVFGHAAFLFTSDGEIVKGSKAYKEWPNRKRVDERWFRVSD